MSKLFRVANKSWWVPASAPVRLAVRLEPTDSFQAAMLAKVQALVDEAGGEDKALELVNPALQELGLPPLEPGGRSLAELLLETEPLEEMVWSASPERAKPAAPDVAAAAVRAQAELELLDLIL